MAGIELLDVSGTLSAWLVNLLLHSTAMLLCAWLLTRSGRLCDRTREWVWRCALLGPLLTASVAPLLLRGAEGEREAALPGAVEMTVTLPREASMPRRTRPGRVDRAVEGSRTLAGGSPAPSLHPAPSRDPAATRGSPFVLPVGRPAVWILSSWLLVAGGLIARVLWSRARLIRGLRRCPLPRAHPLRQLLLQLCDEVGCNPFVELSWSAYLDTPLTVNGREICVPGAVLGQFTTEQQYVVLAHELAHIRRRDPQWLLLLLVLRRLFFFQPLFRVACRRLHETAEFLCDQNAAQWTQNRLGLAHCLAEIGGWVHTRKVPSYLPGMARPESLLLRRVVRLLDDSSIQPSGPVQWRFLMSMMILWVMVFWIPPVIPGQAFPPEPAAGVWVDEDRSPEEGDDSGNPAVQGGSSPGAMALGLRWVPLEEALAQHLGLAIPTAVRVAAVEEGSPAARSGLQPFDILVRVDGEEVPAGLLQQRLSSRSRSSLEVLRRGESIELEFYSQSLVSTEPDGEQRFFTRERLGEDHPFRRLRALHEKERRFSERVSEYSRELRATHQQAQEIRSLAQQEQQNLRKQYDGQIRQRIGLMGSRTLARLQAALAPYGEDFFSAQALERSRVEPEGGTKGLQRSAETIERLFAGELAKDVAAQVERIAAADPRLARAFAEDYQRMLREVLGTEQRTVRPQVSTLSERWESHRSLFDEALRRRTAAEGQLLQSIRGKMQERLQCALERSQQSITAALHERLGDYDVPEPGVVDFALAEAESQVRAHVERVLHRIVPALERFEQVLGDHHEQLEPALQHGWQQWEEALRALEADLAARLREEPRDWPAEKSTLESELRRHLQRTERRLDDALLEGRPALRQIVGELEDRLLQHRRTVDTALEDLDLELREVLSDLSRNCWKLEDPCLDPSVLDEIFESSSEPRGVRRISYRGG